MDSTLQTAAAVGMGAVISSQRLEPGDALARLATAPHLICHATFLIERLGFAANAPRSTIRAARDQRHLDVAELFAFVCPARFATPTPAGLARSLALEPGSDDEETLRLVADDLLQRLANRHYPLIREAAENATFLARANWPWAKAVMQALLKANPRLDVGSFAAGLNVWDRVEEWEDDGGRPPGRQEAVSPQEAQAFLGDILGLDSEPRAAQKDYAAAATYAFEPRQRKEENNILLAEAGTGLGKTLGYLSAAYLWARKNNAPVWVSTYTKNLQRQLDQETTRLVADPDERRSRIVIRKGRENYVCLLNMQEVFGRLTGTNPRSALLAALISRWARFTRDGDMVGGDFPSWVLSLFSDLGIDGEGRGVSPGSLGLTDRRGECIYAACPHYRRCFIERSVRAGRNASIVIANHALVLHQAAVDHALGVATTEEEEAAPGGIRRIVFDEGHHLFDAADSAFSGHLTALETAELRRWLRGPETERRRGRGLADRIGDLVSEDETAEKLLQQVLRAAMSLPGPGWTRRVQAGQPEGPAELFLITGAPASAGTRRPDRRQQHARNRLPAAGRWIVGSRRRSCCRPDRPEAPDDGTRQRAGQETRYRGRRTLDQRPRPHRGGGPLPEAPRRIDGRFMDRHAVAACSRTRTRCSSNGSTSQQNFGREQDVGLHSHWVDPTEPMALAVLKQADGIVITSATLKDRPPDIPDDWANAEMRTGAVHLPYPVKRVSYDSPFDYVGLSRVIVVNDVNREDMDQVAAAYRELFLASGGGALGLFTAIARLRAVHKRLVRPLAEAGLPLYAQHVDPMDTGTLVDMFRAERDACLLGTDAVRDGVDVPGDSLRLIVLDRVPWGTPTILERARKETFGGNAYTDMVVRLRLRQAFGRLIRRAGDKGSFVILDPRLASRFTTAFPPGIQISRVGLVEAIEMVKSTSN